MSSTLAVPATGSTPLPSARLPLGGLLALAAVVFTGVVTEILPAGLLPQMSADLGISDSQVGALVAVYAIATAITAIPLTALTRALPRRTLLVSLVLGFALVNAVTAIAPSYAVILVARVIGGMLAGLLWAMAAGYAMRMVAPERAGRALSIAMVGTPLAFAFGLPIATALGSAMGWREAFGAMAVLSLGLALWAALALPSFPGERAGERPSLLAVLRMPGLAIVLASTGAFVLAHNVAYTYIAPLTRESGLSEHLDIALLVFGVLAVGGVLTAGALVDRHLRGMVVIAVILLGVAMLAIGLWGGDPVVVFLAIGLWGFAYGGAPTLFQSAPARIAGSSADVAQSMVVATWNGSIAIGAFLGGVAIDAAGVWLLPWLTVVLLALAGTLALSSRAAFARVR
ncbi:MAG: MFS transporter [Microterricola sp.]